MGYKVNPECIDCANSMVIEADELFCLIKQEVVSDVGGCEDFN